MRTRRLSVGAGWSRWRTGLLVVLVVGVSALSLPAFSGSTVEPAEEPDIAALVGESLDRRREDPRSQRPLYLPEPEEALSTASAPSPMSSSTLVSKTARWGRLHLPYLIADTALPFRYHVDRALAERFGLDVVVDAVSQWDHVHGSRWSTEFGSVVNHPGDGPRADGHPVVYLRHDCPDSYLGVARWSTGPDRMHLDHRYGSGALYGTQVDIAVCAQVDSADRLRGVLAHEVGHVMGMAHLCEPGEVCWAPQEDDGAQGRCRPMYALWGPCRNGLTERDEDAARHLYPTLPRLYGPSRVETAARASYATTWTHTADTVILARADRGLPEALLGAALSGALGGSLLLEIPDAPGCVTGPAATELARAAADGGTVLLAGEWPQGCESMLSDWNLSVQRLDPRRFVPESGSDSRSARLSVAAAGFLLEQADAPPRSAVIVTLDEDERSTALDAAVAAAAAGRHGAPLLFTHPDELSGVVDHWLAASPDITEAWVLGEAGPGLLTQLGRHGLTMVRVPGADPVERAVYLASSRAPAPARDDHPVVLGPSDSLADTVVAAAVAGKLNAPLLVTPSEPHPQILAWLERYTPRGGYVIGSLDHLPYSAQRSYSVLVEPAHHPVPSQREAPGGRFELPRLLR